MFAASSFCVHYVWDLCLGVVFRAAVWELCLGVRSVLVLSVHSVWQLILAMIYGRSVREFCLGIRYGMFCFDICPCVFFL